MTNRVVSDQDVLVAMPLEYWQRVTFILIANVVFLTLVMTFLVVLIARPQIWGLQKISRDSEEESEPDAVLNASTATGEKNV